MKKYNIITFIAVFLYSTSGLKAETQEINTLSDGIAAFICDEIDNTDDVPLIFTNDENNWNLSGPGDFSVSKIKNGFKFVSSGDEEGFGFLKKISRTEWNFEYLDEELHEKLYKELKFINKTFIKALGLYESGQNELWLTKDGFESKLFTI